MTTTLALPPVAPGTRNPVTARVLVTVPDARTMNRWAAGIDADGVDAHEDVAQRVVAAASSRGLCPVLVDVLADRTEPTVARERAFGRLAQALASVA